LVAFRIECHEPWLAIRQAIVLVRLGDAQEYLFNVHKVDSVLSEIGPAVGLRAARSGMRLGRHSPKDEGDDGSRSVEGLTNLRLLRLGGFSRVAVSPRVLRQRCRRAQVRLERGIDGHALGAELHEVVRLPERPIVPGEESLQRLLDGLLAVERRVTKQGR